MPFGFLHKKLRKLYFNSERYLFTVLKCSLLKSESFKTQLGDYIIFIFDNFNAIITSPIIINFNLF